MVWVQSAAVKRPLRKLVSVAWTQGLVKLMTLCTVLLLLCRLKAEAATPLQLVILPSRITWGAAAAVARSAASETRAAARPAFEMRLTAAAAVAALPRPDAAPPNPPATALSAIEFQSNSFCQSAAMKMP